jgi:hypothetical protein
MFNNYTLLLLATTLFFTACSNEKTIDTLTGSNDSEQEAIAKKDVVYIIKHTPKSVCKSDSFKKAVEKTVEEYIKGLDAKIVNIRNIKTYVQTNDVTCSIYKPSDVTDIIDPICEEVKATDIDESYELPEGVELNELIETSCVITGDFI